MAIMWSALFELPLRKTLSLSWTFRDRCAGFGCQGVRKYMLAHSVALLQTEQRCLLSHRNILGSTRLNTCSALSMVTKRGCLHTFHRSMDVCHRIRKRIFVDCAEQCPQVICTKRLPRSPLSPSMKTHCRLPWKFMLSRK